MSSEPGKLVSRAGEKLDAALEAFDLSVRGLICADFGCNVGGFTDCLLRRGAARVYAVDTGYGQLAWKLRTDKRVVVMERTNALYCRLPEALDLATIDVAWTPQERIVPAALSHLKPGGKVISLVKPHYELAKLAGRKGPGPLSDSECRDVCRRVGERLSGKGCLVIAGMPSPLRGKGGNSEFVLLLAPAQTCG